MGAAKTLHVVCSNCPAGGDSAAVAAAVAAAITAGITLLVAIATARSARATEAAANAGEKEANASLALVNLTRQQMRLGEMPVVMPLAAPRRTPDTFQALKADEAPDVIPRVLDRGVLVVPIINVGAGPAFQIDASFTFLDGDARHPSARQPTLSHPAAYTALGRDQVAELRPVFPGLSTPLCPFTVTISFEDALRDVYAVTATYIPEQEAWKNVDFRPPDDLKPSMPARRDLGKRGVPPA